MDSRRWQINVRDVQPYKAGERPEYKDAIKLNTNESPYPPAPGVIEALRAVSEDELRLYPDPNVSALVGAIATYHGLPKDKVFVGIGSDEVLAMSFMAFFNGTKPLIFPDVTYSFYEVWAELFRIPHQTIPLDRDFRIEPDSYMVENGGIIIANPNAPTGICEDVSLIEKIIRENTDSVVIIDEAYMDFAGKSAIGLLGKYDNLLIVRTFSKSRQLAGLRIGYALGSVPLIGYLSDIKFSFNSYTINAAQIGAAIASIEDESYFRETIANIVATRDWFTGELTRLGFTYPAPAGNFVFARHIRVSARKLYMALREARIYVRFWDKPRISDYLRITIGTYQDMKKMVSFLEGYLSDV